MRTVMLRKIKGSHQLWFPRDAARAKMIVMHAATANQSHATDSRGSGVPSIELKGSRLTVKRQEVVSRLAEATHRGDTSDALMRSMPVVMMIPARQHRRARGRMMVRDAVGPFAQRRLNEALGFAVGLRAIGAREAVVQAQLAAGGGEALRAKCRAVVGEHAPDGDAQGSEVVHARA